MTTTKDILNQAIREATIDQELNPSNTVEDIMSFNIAKDNFKDGMQGKVPAWLKPYVRKVLQDVSRS